MNFLPLLYLLCIFNKLISSIFKAQQLKKGLTTSAIALCPYFTLMNPAIPHYTLKTAPSCKEVKREGELYTCLVAGTFRVCVRAGRHACVCAPLWTPAVRSVFPPRRGPIWLSRDICCSHLMEPHTETLLTCVCGRTATCCLMALCGFRDSLHAVCVFISEYLQSATEGY